MNVNEIFLSIDGEVNGFDGQGQPTVFVRLQGCSAGCDYCDTPNARDPEKGVKMNVGEVAGFIKKIGTRKVTITGGEPLEQPDELYNLLCELPFDVTIETNGMQKLLHTRRFFLCPQIRYVMDVKLMSSKIMNSSTAFTTAREQMIWYNRPLLIPGLDWIKFVICSLDDFHEAKALIEAYDLDHLNIAMSPAMMGTSWIVSPHELLDWMHKEKTYYHINCQLHKLTGMR